MLRRDLVSRHAGRRLLAGGALAIGALAASRPQLAGVVSIGVAAVSVAVVMADRMPRVFISALGALLVGYAFFGRSFAYLGVPPLYMGEIVLATPAVSDRVLYVRTSASVVAIAE